MHIASYSLTTYCKDAGPQLLSVLRSPNSPEPGTVNWGVSLETGVASAQNYPCSFRIIFPRCLPLSLQIM